MCRVIMHRCDFHVHLFICQCEEPPTLRLNSFGQVHARCLNQQHRSELLRNKRNFGFDTYIVSDAMPALEQVSIDGRKSTATDVHVGALSDLQGEFATVADKLTLLQA